jgi:ABC-type multidrug transport system fused ATPase/permease subunit
MFSGTLKFNLDPENAADDKEIEELLKKARLTNILKEQGGLQ